jgi:hypothetical protein
LRESGSAFAGNRQLSPAKAFASLPIQAVLCASRQNKLRHQRPQEHGSVLLGFRHSIKYDKTILSKTISTIQAFLEGKTIWGKTIKAFSRMLKNSTIVIARRFFAEAIP